MFRAEAELGYKRAGLDEISFSPTFIETDEPLDDVDGNVRVWSAMVNAMLDFGDDDDWTGFVGGGVGLASVRYKIGIDDVEGFDGDSVSDSDSSLAWQLIAGIRKSINYNLDFGVKYRYFNVPNVDYEDDFADIEGKFRSHSILASLVYNFGAPPAPPPPPVVVEPPPPPPPTQTCPDGSVILATDTCPPAPEPYVPPPPPPAEPERG
jgi:OmpA-OmpF porin, OOP family